MTAHEAKTPARSNGSLALGMLAKLLSPADARAPPAEPHAARFQAVLGAMAQGVSCFDAANRLVACNERYAEIYGLRPEHVLPGTALREITRRRHAMGSVPPMSEPEYLEWGDPSAGGGPSEDGVVTLRNGKVIAIRHHRMEDGGWIATHEDVTERRRAERQVVHAASHDGLTGLPNQALLVVRLRQALADASAAVPCALLALDLDRFGEVGDAMGRPAGRALLCQIADRFGRLVAEGDFLARAEGDGFAVVQSRADQPAEALRLAEALLRAMAAPFVWGNEQVALAASIGIAVATDGTSDPDTLLGHANIALRHAKATAAGGWRLYAPAMGDAVQARRLLELDLRDAVATMAFELHYQPQVHVRTRRITGFEALLRWRHPVRGSVPPADFIPLAEEIGLIETIGRWVLQQACREAATWPDEVGVAVNVSAPQFAGGALPATVAAALRESGLRPGRLELEITESMQVEGDGGTLAALGDLRRAGVRIAIDDFGVGFSSLGYLPSFPVDKIKIDRSFIGALGQAQERSVIVGAIVHAIIGLCASLGMTCTAEGVETEEQLALLAGEGCTEVQGYLFSRPVPARNVPALLRAMNAADARSPGVGGPVFVAATVEAAQSAR